jgi:hypothetical protein
VACGGIKANLAALAVGREQSKTGHRHRACLPPVSFVLREILRSPSPTNRLESFTCMPLKKLVVTCMP